MATKVQNARVRRTARSEAPTKPDAVAAHSGKATKSQADSFKTGKADKLLPLRPASAAVTFVNRFEKGLHVSSANEALRRKNMKDSALSFYRANPALFFNDQRGAYDAPLLGRPAPQITIGGDTHLANFGIIRGPAPRHEAVWALNDFDQAGTGSPEADLERLAVSAVLTARAKGYSPHDQRELVKTIVHGYLRGVANGGHGYIDSADAHGYVQNRLDKGNSQSRQDLLGNWVHDGKFKKVTDLAPATAAERAALTKAVAAFGEGLSHDAPVLRPITVLDVARRLNAGGSTLGLDRFYVLVAGREGKRARILELKQAPPPAVEGSSPDVLKLNPPAIVQRAAALTGFKSPLYGAATVDGRPMLVREVEPEKVRVEPTDLDPKQLEDLASQAAQMLARSHGHKAELEKWIGNDGEMLKHNLADFAMRYANQAQADWHAYAHS